MKFIIFVAVYGLTVTLARILFGVDPSLAEALTVVIALALGGLARGIYAELRP